MAQPDEQIARCMLTTDQFGAVRELQTNWSLATGQTFEQYDKWGWIYAVDPQHRNWVYDQWKQIVHNEKPAQFSASLFNASSGEYEQANWNCTPLFGDAGQLRHWVVTIFVAEQPSKFEGPCAADSSPQYQSPGECEFNFGTMLEDLECIEKLTSHDMRSPLRKIGNYASLVIDDMGNGLPSEQQERLLQLLNSADRMQRYVDGLQEFIALNIRPIQIKRVSGADILAHAIGSLSDTISTSLAVISSHDLPMVWANAKLLQRVFEALLRNALENCGERSPIVKVNCQVEGENVAIKFLDRGDGVSSVDRDTIFQPFRRGKNRPTLSGIGLGLAFCKRALIKMNGDLLLEETKQGACFVVRLVAAEAETPIASQQTLSQLQPIG